MHMLLIVFKQTYDRVSRNKVSDTLRKFRMLVKVVKLIQMTHNDSRSEVTLNGELTKPFYVRR